MSYGQIEDPESLPSGNDCYIALENGHRNSDLFPRKMVICHSYVNVYRYWLLTIWRFPESWAFPPVLIHLSMGVYAIYHPFWYTPSYGTPTLFQSFGTSAVSSAVAALKVLQDSHGTQIGLNWECLDFTSADKQEVLAAVQDQTSKDWSPLFRRNHYHKYEVCCQHEDRRGAEVHWRSCHCSTTVTASDCLKFQSREREPSLRGRLL